MYGGGLKSPSQEIIHYTCQSFASLDASYVEVIRNSGFPAGIATELNLTSQNTYTGLVCGNHDLMASNKNNRIFCSVFLNNERVRKFSSMMKTKFKHISY